MRAKKIFSLVPILFVAFFFTCSLALAQNYPPTSPPRYPAYQEQEHQEHRMERQEQERREQERREQEWREHQQRFFGGVVIGINPYENEREYRHQVQKRCNIVWQSCANRCTAYPDAQRRYVCIQNCNNYLYECQTLP